MGSAWTFADLCCADHTDHACAVYFTGADCQPEVHAAKVLPQYFLHPQCAVRRGRFLFGIVRVPAVYRTGKFRAPFTSSASRGYGNLLADGNPSGLDRYYADYPLVDGRVQLYPAFIGDPGNSG
ncbi:hypothetical protein D3C75_963330 [compost metagenome]